MESTQPGKFFNTIILILFLIVSALIVKGIYTRQMQLRELKKESSLLDKKITKVKNNIKKIKQQIKMAETDPYYIKHEATNRYMIISKDETIIIFSDNSSKDH